MLVADVVLLTMALVTDDLPDVQARNPVHASWSDQQAAASNPLDPPQEPDQP